MKPFTREDILKSPCGKLNQHLKDKSPDKPAKGNKYRNKPQKYNGITFQSTKECNRYKELLLMQKAGVIGQLELQKKYLLIPATGTEKKTEYWADFCYMLAETGQIIVEDTKSDATRNLSTYVIKRKLMLQVHNLKIIEL